eukprot:TRINITY_DN12080_c1_g1_i2.p2 TRINITY_DN12080_c1_g1~~TRINITY_DN12080_c1_g1_i2.p2  ORF type:complete len:101 (+),score=9.18 TRINITY_DN12080_c1_g1_i2:354-656(+)
MVDAGYFYEEVCGKYGLERDKEDDCEMMLKRAEYVFSVEPEFAQLATAEQETHHKLSSAIMKGYEIPDMDKDPLIISYKGLAVISLLSIGHSGASVPLYK